MCDTAHPAGVTECTKCGARLLPPGVSPFEVPLEPPGAEEPSVPSREDEDIFPEEIELGELEIGEDIAAGPEAAPPWLHKLAGTLAGGLADEDVEAERIERGELPDWLEVPPEFEQLLGEAALIGEEEAVAPAEIPAWLEALRPEPEEGMEEPIRAASPTESAGLLKGIRGTLGIEPILAIARRSVPVEPVAPSSTAQQGAELFGALVREPARPGVTIARQRRVEQLAASSARSMMYLILAAAAVVPILLGSRWSEANMPITAGTRAMYEAIEALPEGAVVLVSHDYDPGLAGEMLPQARAVLGHLFERGAQVVSVSLTPEGARLSRQVFDEVGPDRGYAEGQGYQYLGYVVGVEAGPRAVVEGLSTAGWSDLVSDVGDIALIVDLAGTPESLKLWLEQVQGPYRIPMVAGVSATVDPFARPYYRNEASHQLLGLMTGLVGAAEYEQLSGEAGSAMAGMDSQSLVHIAIILLILVGNVAYFAGRLRGRPGG